MRKKNVGRGSRAVAGQKIDMPVAGCGAIQGSLDWILPRNTRSGRSAAWLARLVRDQEVEGSNPFAPTTFLPSLSCTYAIATQTCSTESVAHVAQLTSAGGSDACDFDACGSSKPSPTFSAHSFRYFTSSRSWRPYRALISGFSCPIQ